MKDQIALVLLPVDQVSHFVDLHLRVDHLIVTTFVKAAGIIFLRAQSVEAIAHISLPRGRLVAVGTTIPVGTHIWV